MGHAMICAPQPEAAEIGAAILARGGNAFDAAIACAFAQGVCDNLRCGIGGFGFAQVYDARSGTHTSFDFMSTAPAAVTPTMWEALLEGETRDGFGFILKDRVNDVGYRSVAVPGMLRGYEAIHSRFGRLPWGEVVAPAIALASDGYTVTPFVRNYWVTPERMGRVEIIDRIAHTATAAPLYFDAAGQPHAVGTRVRNPELAATLGIVAREGAASFFDGTIAERIDVDFRAHDGLLSRADLAGYRATERAVHRGRYRGWEIAVPAPPSSGLMLLQMLGTLEHFDLAALGFNTPAYLRVLTEVMKRGQIDKERHIGDPDFAPVPLDVFADGARHAAAAEAIRRGEKVEVPRLKPVAAESADTTHLSVVDAEGSIVSMTHTLGMQSGVITPGLGFMYNAAMAMFDPRPGRAMSLAPGKKRVSSMAPSILFKDGRPALVIGAPGGSNIPMGILQVILNVIDFGMSIVEATDAPRIAATGNVIDASHRIPQSTCEALRRDGYRVLRSAQSYIVARPHSIRIEGERLTGGADPSAGGVALLV